MIAWQIATGVALGVCGGLAHLGITWLRARWAAQGALHRAWLSYPLALAAPALSVLVAAQISHESAWSTVIGLLLIRTWVLRKLTVPS